MALKTSAKPDKFGLPRMYTARDKLLQFILGSLALKHIIILVADNDMSSEDVLMDLIMLLKHREVDTAQYYGESFLSSAKLVAHPNKALLPPKRPIMVDLQH